MKIIDRTAAFEFALSNEQPYVFSHSVRLADPGFIGYSADTFLTNYTEHEVVRSIKDMFELSSLKQHLISMELRIEDDETSSVVYGLERGSAMALLERLVPDDLWWLWRENARLLVGQYKMPNSFEYLRRSNEAYVDRMRELWWHFPHASTNNDGLIAYTQSPEKGLRDIQTPTKIGRYLQQFFGDLLPPETIRTAADMFKGAELKFASSGEEIADVYMRGPSSCMSRSNGSYGFRDIHPVMVYEGEFRLAYMTEGDEIIARALVHEPSKTFVRCYGREANQLQDQLVEQGYDHDDGWPEGARLKALQEGDRYAMPYIDGSIHDVTFHGDHFTLTGCGTYTARSQEGYWRECSRRYCEHCGNDVEADEDDDWDWYEEGRYDVCPDCRDNHFTWAYAARGNYIMCSNYDVIEADGESYHQNYLSDNDIVYSEYTNEYSHIDSVVADSDGDYMPLHRAVPVGEYHVYVDSAAELIAKQLIFVRQPDGTALAFDDIDDADLDGHIWFMDDFGTLVSPTVFSGEQLLARTSYRYLHLRSFIRNELGNESFHLPEWRVDSIRTQAGTRFEYHIALPTNIQGE
jgi:hypothetical protein